MTLLIYVPLIDPWERVLHQSQRDGIAVFKTSCVPSFLESKLAVFIGLSLSLSSSRFPSLSLTFSLLLLLGSFLGID